MTRRAWTLAAAWAMIVCVPGATFAITRDLAELQQARLTFSQSVLNQLSYDTYRDPFDELQTRPYNLLFNNIGRYPNLSPWQGQTGNYTRYFNALIGNNGVANVDNDADALQGSLVRRETAAVAWGLSAAVLAGNSASDDASGVTTFADRDDLEGYDVRAGSALQISERRVLGVGLRVVQAAHEIMDSSFEQGVGGFTGSDEFDQSRVTADVGLRHFLGSDSSWEAQLVGGFGDAQRTETSVDLDDTGLVTDRFVIANYDVSDLYLGVAGGYNRLRLEGLGETAFRAGLERSQRELDNSDLAFTEMGGVVTPNLTLLGQDALTTTRLYASARSVFQAGETEMFAGAELGHTLVEGSTRVDAAGTIVNEAVDDSASHLGLTVGLRQPLLNDKLRFLVSGRADLVDQEQGTTFDTGSDQDDSTQSVAQYAIGLEGVLANVTFDLAWLAGEEAPVVPVPLGLPVGSRRTVELDRMVFSAAVAW